MIPFAILVLIVYSIGAFGLAWTIGHSALTYPLRKTLAAHFPTLVEGLECLGCIGFWIGVGAGVGYSVGSNVSTDVAFWIAVTIPFYTTGSNYILGRLTGLILRDEA